MELWVRVSLLLCMFGFFKELRPSEPFVTPYLVGPWRNFTDDQVNKLIYPVGTYSYLALLVLVFLVTDILRYKAVILLDGICGIIAWSLLTWVPGLLAAQVLEFFYGAFQAGEVAYYSYAYARVENRELYARLTSYTRAAYLFGRCASGVLGQALYSTQTLNLWALNIISVSCLGLAFVIALFLPPVKHSIYFHPKEIDEALEGKRDGNDSALPNDEEHSVNQSSSSRNLVEGSLTENHNNSENSAFPQEIGRIKSIESNGCIETVTSEVLPSYSSVESVKVPHKPKNPEGIKRVTSFFTRAFQLLWKHAYTSYSDRKVVRWSAWWAISTAGFYQVLSYIQVLWEVIIKENGEKDVALLNGAVEAIQTVLGALATLACGWLPLNWEFVGEFTLAGVAVIEGLVMLVSATTHELWVSYVCYVIFGVLYQSMVTVASMEVAKRLEGDCYGLIFGINTFVALVLQTIWTVVIVTDAGFALNIRDQFLVNGGYYLLLGLIFLVVAIVSTYKMGLRVFLNQQLWHPKPESTTGTPE